MSRLRAELLGSLVLLATCAALALLIGGVFYLKERAEAARAVTVRPMSEEEAREAVRTVCGRPPTLYIPAGHGAAVIDHREDAVYLGGGDATLAIVGTGSVRCAVCATNPAAKAPESWILFDDVPRSDTLSIWRGGCARRAVTDNLSYVARLPGGASLRAAAAAQSERLIKPPPPPPPPSREVLR